MRFKQIVIALGIVAAILIAFAVGQKYPQKQDFKGITEKVDTLYIRDTITLQKPISVERVRLDSVLIPVVDSVKIHDTLFVYLEREQVIWQDSLSCVYASGILPQVDSVRHFLESRIITIEKSVPVKVDSHWGFGIQAGMGAGKAGLTPYVGIGLSYNILSW